MKIRIECNECYTEAIIEILDGDADLIVCCPFCHDQAVIQEEVEEDE